MKRVILLVSMLLLTSMTACMIKWLSHEPESNLRAVTDGKLTLGVVPSRDEQSGMDAYRLLLCKKSAAHSEQHFNDSNFCRAALQDASGAEVVLLANELRRSVGAKYAGYTAGVAALVLAAFGAKQGVKWVKMSSKHIDNSSQSLMSEAVEALERRASKLGKNTDTLQKELEASLAKADAKSINRVVMRFKRIDPELGNELEAIIASSNAPLKQEVLELLTKRTREVDTTFAKKLQGLKRSSKVSLGDDGVLFYRETYENIFVEQHKWVMDNLTKNVEELMKKKPSNFVEELTTAVVSRREGALLLDAASELRLLEQYHKTLKIVDNNDSEALVKQIQKVRDHIAKQNSSDFPIDTGLAARLGIDNNADFSTKFLRIKEKYQALKEDNYFAILKPDAGMSDYQKHVDAVELENLYLRGADTFYSIRNNQEYLKFYDKANTGVYRRELNKVSNDIAKARERLLTLEAGRVDTAIYAPQVERFWQRLASLESLEPTENILRKARVAELRKELGVFKLTMEKHDLHLLRQQELLDNLQGKYAHLNKDIEVGRKILAGREQNLKSARAIFASFNEQLKNAEQGNFDEVKKLMAAMEADRKLWKNSTLMRASLATGLGIAAYAMLDTSIWGHGEKVIGKKYWQQIFASDKGFANPLPVNNLPEIMHQIAQIFGKNVNQSAFDLR